MEPDKTSTLLIEHLLGKPESIMRDSIIFRAKSYKYDDFRSNSVMPKTELYYHLHNAGFTDLATNVTKGIYD